MKVFVTGGTGVFGTMVRAVMPSDSKLLMKSLRISNPKRKGASDRAPLHPSMRGSWST
jgi:hypothetical protein